MVAIHYLSQLDKIKAYETYRAIISDLTKIQLELLLLTLINGAELDYAFDFVMGFPKKVKK